MARALVAALFVIVGAGQVVHNAVTLHVRCAVHDEVHDVRLAGRNVGSRSSEARPTNRTTDDGHLFCLSALFTRTRAAVSHEPVTSYATLMAPVAVAASATFAGIAIYRYAPANSPPF